MSGFIKILGPGILFAATAIGVSHLVQSTTAGAQFGLSMLIFVVLSNVLKYPFFDYGSRYAAVTGKTLIHGYSELHRVWIVVFSVFTIISALMVTATVGAVTIGFLEKLFHFNQILNFKYATHLILFSSCFLILYRGGFNSLEKVIKMLGILLLVGTLIAFISAIFKGPIVSDLFPALAEDGWLFLLPLMGWMPTAVDLSTWNSIWTVEKTEQMGLKIPVKDTLKEFAFGYWISAILAVFFVFMGAFLVYGSDKVIPNNAVEFSQFVIDLYTTSIGGWAFYFISIAAFSIMFSTFIAVLDGYTRSIHISFNLLRKNTEGRKSQNAIILTIIGTLSLLIIFVFEHLGSFRILVNSATILSFLFAPVIAILNFRLVQKDKIGNYAPGIKMRILSYVGIIFLIGFSVWYLITVISR